ncbi:MAG TPA: methyltransferase domain-containing protein [Trebonia sp.]|nr:methyltransferase domain-containing protein [Trebonia sp.]
MPDANMVNTGTISTGTINADIVNTGQADAWNGYEGEHWAANADRYDIINNGFNEPLLDAAGIGETSRVLDIGCGAGKLARLAARRAHRGQVTGVDLSGPMLAVARARAVDENLANATFALGDAQVYPFPAGGFDAAVSRFGVMFFADPVAAFANIGRGLRPGGRLAFACLPEMSGRGRDQVFRAVAAELPAPPSPPVTGTTSPESFADPERARDVLTDAGFADVHWTLVETDQVWGRDVADAADFIWGWGPVQYRIRDTSADAAARARAVLTNALKPYTGPGGVVLPGGAWLVTARWSRG